MEFNNLTDILNSSDYEESVHQPWKIASDVFKKAGNPDDVPNIVEKGNQWFKFWDYEVSEQSDWEWTKWQIYEDEFENIWTSHINDKLSYENAYQEWVSLWNWRIRDLFAMNTDDHIQWQVCFSLSDYIHVNYLAWRKWMFFVETFWQAMKDVVTDIGIKVHTWETAIMGHSPEAVELLHAWQEEREKIIKIVTATESTWYTIERQQTRDDLIKKICETYDEWSEIAKKILWKIRVSLSWTSLAVSKSKKAIEKNRLTKDSIDDLNDWTLESIKAWDAIIMIQESPYEWIIWARANWYTAIREGMKEKLWENRWSILFDDIHSEYKHKYWISFNNELVQACKWKKLRQIATWRSTIFNPFVSRDVLNADKQWEAPIVLLSWMAHVTGDPLYKLTNILKWNNNLQLNLDYKDVVIPHICQILQIIWWVNDKTAMNQWNMWVPYVLSCDESKVNELIELGKEKWYVLKKIWSVYKKTSSENKFDSSLVPRDVRIENAWINNSTIIFYRPENR